MRLEKRDKAISKTISYAFSSGSDYWEPYPDLHYGISYANIGKKAVLLELINNTEEFLHRRFMMATRTRFEMAWEQALTINELLSLKDAINKSYMHNKNFKLLIPLHFNLTLIKAPSSVNKIIRNLLEAENILRRYLIATEPFIESTTWVYLEKLFLGYDKNLFNERLTLQLQRYPFLSEIYPKARKAMYNYTVDLPIASMILSPQKPKLMVPLTLQESFKSFNRQRAKKIEYRFSKFCTEFGKIEITSKQKFVQLTEELNWHYLNDDDIFDIVMSTYQDKIQQIMTSSPDIKYIFVPINNPITMVIDKSLSFEDAKLQLLNRMGKKENDMQSGIFLANTLFTGTSSIHLVESLDRKTKKVEFHPNISREMQLKFISTAIMVYFKNFLIYGFQYCPLSKFFKECDNCLLSNINDPEFLNRTETKLQCPACHFLKEINNQIIINQQ